MKPSKTLFERARDNATPTQELKKILAFNHPSAPLHIAARDDLDEDLMQMLAQHQRPNVRLKLLEKNGDDLPEGILTKLTEDKVENVRDMAEATLKARKKKTTST